ncbi:hypothetical protein MAQ58_21945, partial [Enterobacter sp. DRP3]|nr:hypothetical protein [Enterobacter sp. DRP3]
EDRGEREAGAKAGEHDAAAVRWKREALSDAPVRGKTAAQAGRNRGLMDRKPHDTFAVYGIGFLPAAVRG